MELPYTFFKSVCLIFPDIELSRLKNKKDLEITSQA